MPYRVAILIDRENESYYEFTTESYQEGLERADELTRDVDSDVDLTIEIKRI